MVVEALYPTGATQVTLDLVRGWRRGEALLLVRKRLPAHLSVDPAGAPVRVLGAPARTARWAMPRFVLRLARFARRADVIVVGSEIGMVVLLGFLAARLARRPFVVSVHANLDLTLVEWVPLPLRPLFRTVHRRADGAVAVEQSLVGQLERNGLPANRIRVVRNGIDVEAVRRAAASDDPLPDVTGARIVTTGRLSAEKGNDVALRAHAKAVKQTPHTLVVLNEGPEEPTLRRLAGELGVTGSVRFVGRTLPHPFVGHADAYCLPSRHEGLPLSLLEAMAVGTPVIAADCSEGVRTALDHGRLGALVPADDPTSMARAFVQHLRNPAVLRARAETASAEIDRFSDTAMTEGWVSAIDDFVAAWRQRRTACPARARG